MKPLRTPKAPPPSPSERLVGVLAVPGSVPFPELLAIRQVEFEANGCPVMFQDDPEIDHVWIDGHPEFDGGSEAEANAFLHSLPAPRINPNFRDEVLSAWEEHDAKLAAEQARKRERFKAI